MKNSVCFVIIFIVMCMSGFVIATDEEGISSPPINKGSAKVAVTTWGDIARINTDSQYPPANLETDSVTQAHSNTLSPIAAQTSGCRLPYRPSSPDPCDGADDVMADVVLSWARKPQLPPSPPPAPVNITFDEVPLNTIVDGMTIRNASFSTSMPGRARVTMLGPQTTMFNAPPNIESDTSDVLTINFAVPVYGVAYGFVCSSSRFCANATTITLFDAAHTAVVTQSANAEDRGYNFAEGRNITNSSVPITKAVIMFSNPYAGAFTLDNLTYSLSPETILTNSAVSAEQLIQVQSGVEDVIFYDDMESGQQGWQHYWISGKNISDKWILSNSRSASGTHSWHSGTTAQFEGDTALESPVIDLGGSSTARLVFEHWYRFDDCGDMTFEPDGGIVEIRVLPSSAWVQIFPVGGYPGHIMDTACGPNPLAGRDAYTHNSGGVFVPAEFDLTPFVGNMVHIRFRVGWDCGNCGLEEGWYIDDVTVFGDASDPNTVYDVYLSDNNQPDVLYAGDLNEPQCFVRGLDCNTTYFWKVVAKNECGETEGPTWSFRTLTSTDMLRRVIDEKHKLIDRINQLIDSEASANRDITAHILDRRVRIGERINYIKAKQKIHSAIQHEIQSKDAIDKSIEKLWDALWTLGFEDDSQNP